MDSPQAANGAFEHFHGFHALLVGQTLFGPEVLDQNGVEADEMDAFVIKRPVVPTKHAFPSCTHVQVPVVFARNDHHFGFQIGQYFFALDQLVFGSVLGNITTVEHKVRLNF